jgi:hypothetical protein
MMADRAEGRVAAIGLVRPVVLVAPESADALDDGLAGLAPGHHLVGVQRPAQVRVAVAPTVAAVELEDDACAIGRGSEVVERPLNRVVVNLHVIVELADGGVST